MEIFLESNERWSVQVNKIRFITGILEGWHAGMFIVWFNVCIILIICNLCSKVFVAIARLVMLVCICSCTFVFVLICFSWFSPLFLSILLINSLVDEKIDLSFYRKMLLSGGHQQFHTRRMPLRWLNMSQTILSGYFL